MSSTATIPSITSDECLDDLLSSPVYFQLGRYSIFFLISRLILESVKTKKELI